ncbi:uncharacterized protein Dwil_GK27133, partial [Drosophila willistoni]
MQQRNADLHQSPEQQQQQQQLNNLNRPGLNHNRIMAGSNNFPGGGCGENPISPRSTQRQQHHRP